MPPKKGGKKGGKKKAEELTEPEHDASWEKAVDSGVWDRPPAALPDANIWPTWGALRERVLMSCKEIKIVNSPSVRDAFATELFRLSPPELVNLELRGSSNLRKVVLSPEGSCPQLARLDLAHCQQLQYLLIQAPALQELNLQGNQALTKVLIQCKQLKSLNLSQCPNLSTVMVWSDELTEVDLASAAGRLQQVVLQCPRLEPACRPRVPGHSPSKAPAGHPAQPLSYLLKESDKDARQKAHLSQLEERRQAEDDFIVAKVFRDA